MEEYRNEKAPDLSGAYVSAYSGKRILVTGAGGSIGSQLVKQLAGLAPERIAGLDKDENALYELEKEFNLNRFPIAFNPFVVDIRDAGRLSDICKSFSPQVIFHAAAFKHVSLMEHNPCEAILGNVLGTENLLNIAAGFGAERLLFISTISAVNSVSVMGATKRIGEMLVQCAAKAGRIRTASIRLGNVIGSRGSVIPLFHQQIKNGGPVTVTHPEIARYFISMRRAVRMILCAGAEANEGETYTADFGKPRKICELAREMILLSGADAEREIDIQFIGLRPGEKLIQETTFRSERPHKTNFEGLMAIDPAEINERAMKNNITQLIQSARSSDLDGVYRILTSMTLGFTHADPSVQKEIEVQHFERAIHPHETIRPKRSEEISRAAAAGSARDSI